MRLLRPEAAAISSPVVPAKPRSRNSLVAFRETARRASSRLTVILARHHLSLGAGILRFGTSERSTESSKK
jgi:hypothetical protein